MGNQGRQPPPFLWFSAGGLVQVLADEVCWRLTGRGGIARGLQAPHFSVRWGRRRWGGEGAPFTHVLHPWPYIIWTLHPHV